MNQEIIILRDIREPDDWRNLQVRFDDNGDLLIEGHDMGASVETFFGEGSNEYEWVTTVKAKDVRALNVALGGKRGDDTLELIRNKCTGENAIDLEQLIKKKDIPKKFWSWNSDS